MNSLSVSVCLSHFLTLCLFLTLCVCLCLFSLSVCLTLSLSPSLPCSLPPSLPPPSLSLHPADLVLRFILEGFQIAELATYAANTIHSVCHKCKMQMLPHFEWLVRIIEAADSFSVSNNSIIGLLSGEQDVVAKGTLLLLLLLPRAPLPWFTLSCFRRDRSCGGSREGHPGANFLGGPAVVHPPCPSPDAGLRRNKNHLLFFGPLLFQSSPLLFFLSFFVALCR